MWPFTGTTITFEQAVYGSFPFWHRGYDLLGQSSGCETDWISAMKWTCQHLGERLRGVAPPGGLVTRWLDDGTWLIIRPFSPGTDDFGRPDAVAFHAIFLNPEGARSSRYDPFRLISTFRNDWGPDDAFPPSGSLTIRGRARSDGPLDPRIALVVEALGKGRRVLVEANEPIDKLTSLVWNALPKRLRQRRTFATWAYTDAGIFDVVGLPRLTGVDPTDRRLLIIPLPTTDQGTPERVVLTEKSTETVRPAPPRSGW